MFYGLVNIPVECFSTGMKPPDPIMLPSSNRYLALRVGWAIVLMSLLGSPCAAQSRDELDRATDSAVLRAAQLDKADAGLVWLMKKSSADLGMDDYHLAAVETLLKGWRTYTSLECGLVGQVTGGQPMARSTFAQLCQERRLTARIPIIGDVTTCLSRELAKAVDDRLATECLMPLTPLRAPGDYDA